MARERPIVLINAARLTKWVAGTQDKRPRPSFSPSQQNARFGSTFERLRQTLDQIAATGEATADSSEISPDNALVLELISPIQNFNAEAVRVGLEWLAEVDLPDDDADKGDQDEVEELEGAVDRRLYVAMPTKTALKHILELWDRFKAGGKAPERFSQWWAIFNRLSSLRAWGVEDRIDPQTLAYLRQQLLEHPGRNVRLEFDLWYSDDPVVREERAVAFADLVKKADGKILDEVVLTPIQYSAALVELPASQAGELAQAAGALARAKQIMSIRPQSFSEIPGGDRVQREQNFAQREAQQLDDREPIAALLDGFPVENHQLLRNRVDVYPIDVEAADVSVRKRRHGTQMASLILHGDIDAGEQSLDRRLLVVPVLSYSPGEDVERTPDDLLPIGIIERAVEAIKNNENGSAPLGPKVVVLNHSLGDEGQPFIRRASHWAKLLDHLAFKHNVLFVVSAGNVRSGFSIEGFADISAYRSAHPDARKQAILLGLERAKNVRGMLSPAEAMNALTIGSVHHDASAEAFPPASTDPYPGSRMINLGSGLGLGIADSVKPDIVLPGGRQAARPQIGTPFRIVGQEIEQVGQLAACPDEVGARLHLVQRSTGTSNAAALATRFAIRAADALDEVFNGDAWLEKNSRAVILKALVAHSASWSDVGTTLDNLYPPNDNSVARRKNIARFIGFGEPDIEAVLSGARNRITLLGYGEIKNNQRHEFEIPLPDALSSRAVFRRITATLAWTSPIRNSAQNHRAVGLRLTGPGGKTDYWEGVSRTAVQPSHAMASRGTLLHTVLDGAQAIPFASGSNVSFGIQCRAATSKFNQIMSPYAIAVSLEVGSGIEADVYQQVRQEVLARAAQATQQTPIRSRAR